MNTQFLPSQVPAISPSHPPTALALITTDSGLRFIALVDGETITFITLEISGSPVFLTI